MNYNVMIYSSDSCKFCQKLKKWLDSQNISYVNKDVKDEGTLKEFNKYNANAIPFTIIFDKKRKKEERITGFNPEQIMRILKG